MKFSILPLVKTFMANVVRLDDPSKSDPLVAQSLFPRSHYPHKTPREAWVNKTLTMAEIMWNQTILSIPSAGSNIAHQNASGISIHYSPNYHMLPVGYHMKPMPRAPLSWDCDAAYAVYNTYANPERGDDQNLINLRWWMEENDPFFTGCVPHMRTSHPLWISYMQEALFYSLLYHNLGSQIEGCTRLYPKIVGDESTWTWREQGMRGNLPLDWAGLEEKFGVCEGTEESTSTSTVTIIVTATPSAVYDAENTGVVAPHVISSFTA